MVSSHWIFRHDRFYYVLPIVYFLSGIDIVGKKMESSVHKFFCCYNINERCTVLEYKIIRICYPVAQTILSDAFNNMYTINIYHHFQFVIIKSLIK